MQAGYPVTQAFHPLSQLIFALNGMGSHGAVAKAISGCPAILFRLTLCRRYPSLTDRSAKTGSFYSRAASMQCNRLCTQALALMASPHGMGEVQQQLYHAGTDGPPITTATRVQRL